MNQMNQSMNQIMNELIKSITQINLIKLLIFKFTNQSIHNRIHQLTFQENANNTAFFNPTYILERVVA